jgi:large exoprotein involved in heme utilization and adhesion
MIAAPSAPGAVSLSPRPVGARGAATLGPISVLDDAQVDVSGDGGGRILVRGGALTLRNGGALTSVTLGRGHGGAIDVSAGDLTIDGGASQGATGIFTGVTAAGSGHGGDVRVAAARTTIAAGGQIGANTAGAGHAGRVTVRSDSLQIAGGGDPTQFTGIGSNSNAGATGDAGDVRLSVADLHMASGGSVTADSFGTGHSGSVTVSAGHLTIDGTAAAGAFTGISSDALSSGAGGGGGKVTVRAKMMQVANGGTVTVDSLGSAQGGHLTIRSDALAVTAGGQITTLTFGPGNAARLSVRAGTLTIDDRDNPNPNSATGIVSDSTTGASGNGGPVAVSASAITLLAGGEIEAGTFGTGNAASLTVHTRSVTIDGTGSSGPQRITGVSSQSNPGATGDAGDVRLFARDVTLTAGGQISATTFGPGRGGNVSVAVADHLTVDGTGEGNAFTGVSSNASGTDPASGPAGDLALRARRVDIVAGGQITADTSGPGRGGRLTLWADQITIDGSLGAPRLGHRRQQQRPGHRPRQRQRRRRHRPRQAAPPRCRRRHHRRHPRPRQRRTPHRPRRHDRRRRQPRS